MASPRVNATPEALELIERLHAAHGPLAFFLSAGCCEGSAPICVRESELTPRAVDTCLGEIGGAPVYIDADQDARWGRPEFVVDIAAGASDTLSLEGPHGFHFVSLDARRDERHNGAT